MVTPADPRAWGAPAQAVEVVSSRRKDAKYFQTGNEFVGVFGHHLHYEASPGVWEESDLTLVPAGLDHVMDRAFFHARVTGAGVEATDPETGFGVRWLTPTRPVVANERAQFARDGLSWEYSVSTLGLKLSAAVAAARGPHTYDFTYQLLGGADFTIDADGNAQGDGFVVTRARVEGADGEQYVGGPWRLEAGPRLSFDFDDSVLPPEAFPYVIDPSSNFDIAAGGDDGSVQFRNVNPSAWPPTTFFQADTAGTPLRTARDSNGFDEINVILFRWDTSSLADNAILSEAKLDVHIEGKDDDDARNLTFDWYLFVGTLAEEDYVQEALTDAHTGIDITGISTGVVVSFVMNNEDGVSLTGFTGLRGHTSGGEPVGRNRVSMRMFEGTPDPRLIITFTIPAPIITSVVPNEGTIDGGTSVTITGTDLDNASSVTFGGTEVTSIDSNTSTQIVVTTAAHAAGLVDVIVTTPGGSDTEVDAFTYRDVAITSVTPVSGPIAGGNEVTIFGTDLAGATSVTFGGTEVTSIDENSATRIAVTVAAHALGLVDVVVTTPGGSDTAVNAYDFLDPTITSIVPDSGPSSGGTSVTITGTDLDDASSVTFGGVAASDLFADTHGINLTAHTSDTGETWSKVSPGGEITINTAFGPNVPAARSSSGILTQYLWTAQGRNGIFESFLENFGGGGTATCGLFFRRNASSEEYFQVLLETASGASDSTLRLQFIGAGAVNLTVTLVGKTNGVVRVEFSGSAIDVYFDNILKISTSSSLNQNDVGLGLVKAVTGGSRISEWDTLSYVDGGEITSNSTTEIVVTTPPGPVGLVDVVVTNPGGETTEVDGYTYLAGGGTGALLQLEREFLL